MPAHPKPDALPRVALAEIVGTALREDLGRGDITTDACIGSEVRAAAHLVAQEPLVFCGAPVASEVFGQVDPSLEVKTHSEEGSRLNAGETALSISGRAASILRGERVALNFVQRMSGVATLARAYVDQLPAGSATRITDTRKTTPGLRVLERYAVRCGGAHNHRQDLSAAVLIKDNHIAACGGIRQAVEAVRANAPHTSRITCEVEDLEQLQQALDAGVDIIMLDNFSDALLRRAVGETGGRATVEVSGGVTLQRVAAIAEAGVDIISVGALTHSAPAADLSLKWVRSP